MTEAQATQGRHAKRVGERIAEARKALKLELEDVAERSRIPLRHLQAIEDSNFEALPASTYSIGFAKTFARMVGLDGEEIAADFRAERGETLARRTEYTPFEPADPSRVPPSLLAMVALGTAVILLVAYLIWRGGWRNEERQQLAAGTQPVAEAPAAPARPAPKAAPTAAAPVPSPNDRVVLTAIEEVWIKVTDKGNPAGPTLFMGQLAPGQSYQVPADAKDPRLLTGRPQVLRVQIGAREIPPLGKGDRTINNVSLKGPALIERSAASAAPPAPPSAALPSPAQPATAPLSHADQANGNVASPATP
jgi:transcriptional regulator with XRE-family HTH domain